MREVQRKEQRHPRLLGSCRRTAHLTVLLPSSMGYSCMLGKHFYSVSKVLGGHSKTDVLVPPDLNRVAARTLRPTLLPKHAYVLRAMTHSSWPTASLHSRRPSLVQTTKGYGSSCFPTLIIPWARLLSAQQYFKITRNKQIGFINECLFKEGKKKS